jgi:hybrid cluster-associated redox disulfide protein
MTFVTKDSIIADILDMDKGTAVFFLQMGMRCLGCPSARGETIFEACKVHNQDTDALLAKINNYLLLKK